MRKIAVFAILFFLNQGAEAVNLQKITAQYNKNLKMNSFFKSKVGMDQAFLKDFEKHVRSQKTQNFLKADLIGGTVYFKEKGTQLSIKPDIQNAYTIQMKVNGKDFTFKVKEGFAKNYQLLKILANAESVSLLDLIISKAQASELEAPPELDHALSSALSWSSWAISAVKDEGKLEKEKICNLNKKEKSNYTPSATPAVMFDEVKYFVKVQNKYVKPVMQNDSGVKSTGNEVCMEDCEWAKEFQGCLNEMAQRRKTEISREEVYGFSCFEKYEDGGVYLNSDILDQSLQSLDYSDSYEFKLKKIDHDKKFECGTLINDSEVADCNRKIKTRLAELEADCPQNAQAASTSNSHSNSRGSK